MNRRYIQHRTKHFRGDREYPYVQNIGNIVIGYAVNKFAKSYFYQFYDVPQWINHMKRYNFVMGSRIHGAIVAIQAGVPAFIIVHDSRTKELAEFFNIPYVDKSYINSEINIEEFYDRLDYTKFNGEYGKKFRDFKDFLRINGIEN